jgi:hypothetical protein
MTNRLIATVRKQQMYAQIPKVNGSLHYLIVAPSLVFDLKCCCQQWSANEKEKLVKIKISFTDKSKLLITQPKK